MNKLLLTIICCLLPCMLLAQTVTDTANMDVDTTGQKDLIDVGRKLFQPDRRRQSRRAAADDDDVIIHPFAGNRFCHRCFSTLAPLPRLEAPGYSL